MRAHRGAVAYCVRADARRSWPSWLALGTLVGLAAGAAMAAAAAGNRTDSAYRDLQAETNAMNGSIVFTCEPTDADCPTTVEEVQAVPGIRSTPANRGRLRSSSRSRSWASARCRSETGTSPPARP